MKDVVCFTASHNAMLPRRGCLAAATKIAVNPKWSLTSMHQALQIEEILINIFSFCYVKRRLPRRLARRQLWYANSRVAALARTCKTFKEPALDMIWAELDDLTPLVRCLSEASWVESEGVRRYELYIDVYSDEIPCRSIHSRNASSRRSGRSFWVMPIAYGPFLACGVHLVWLEIVSQHSPTRQPLLNRFSPTFASSGCTILVQQLLLWYDTS